MKRILDIDCVTDSPLWLEEKPEAGVIRAPTRWFRQDNTLTLWKFFSHSFRYMPIGITIETIAGSVRQSAPTVNTATLEAKTGSGGQESGVQAAAGGQVNTSQLSGQLAPGFSVVVLQVLNEQGAVIATIPTAQQLAAYRNGTATPPSAQ